MTLLQTIRDDALMARKERRSLEATLLTTLGSEAAMVGKNAANRDSTDAEVTAVIKKFLKNNGETLAVLPDGEARDRYVSERSILERYVEAELSEAELSTAIAQMGEVSARDMGRVMASLNGQYPGRINGKLVKEILSRA